MVVSVNRSFSLLRVGQKEKINSALTSNTDLQRI